MILYKYRSLLNLEFVLDIILNERLHCCPYSQLNDPFEGLFYSVFDSPFGRHKHYQSVENLCSDSSETKICSLSSSLADVRLWSHYADGHKGVVIEIDFSGLESEIYKVNYSDRLPLGGSSLATRPLPYEVLSRKTNHWEYEAEYRIFNENEFFDISNRLKGVYLGTRISDTHYSLLTKIMPDEIPIYTTKINTEKIAVELNERVQK
jgi:hypothetical protein